MRIGGHSLVVVAMIALVIISGTYIYHSVEGWGYLDSVYFLVITATTIGYGDVTPQTGLGKIITIFYAFIGIGIFLYLVSLVSHYVFEKKVKTRITNIKERRGETKKKRRKK